MAGKKGKNRSMEMRNDDLVKFLLFRFLCCERKENFRNFVLLDRKGSKRLDDFVFMFDTDKNKTKYFLLKLVNQNAERNYSCMEDVMKAFDLSHYIDYYLSTDEYLKDAKLEEVIIFTNTEIIDYFVLLKKKKCKNILSKSFLGRNVKLYKLSLDNTEIICDVFYEQFLSQRKRLANELSMYVMLGKPIGIQFLIKNNSCSLIKTFYLMLLKHVIDEDKNQFRESFLSLSEMYETEPIGDSLHHKKLEVERIKKFQEDFYESVVEFSQMFQNKDDVKLKHVFNYDASQEEIERVIKIQQNFMFLSNGKNNYKEITKFLRSKKNLLIEIPEEEIIHLVAKELALSVMLQKTFDISSIIPNQKMLSKFTKIIKENVFEYKSKKLKETFLNNNNSNDSEIIIILRKCFYYDLTRLYHLCKNKDIKELYRIIISYCSPLQVDHSSVAHLHETLKLFKIEERGFSDFLLSREIEFRNFFDKNVSSCFFPSEKVDKKTVFKIVLEFLDVIKFAVIKDNTSFLISREIKKIVCNKENAIAISDGFSEFVKKWQQYDEVLTVFRDFDSNFEYRNWITKQNLINDTCVLFKDEIVKFSDICSECEVIPPRSLFNLYNNDKMPSLGNGISRHHGSIYMSRTLSQSKKVDASVFYTFSKDIVILTVGRNFSIADFAEKHSIIIEFRSLRYFNSWESYFYTTDNFSYSLLEEFYNKNKEIIGNRSIHWVTDLGSDLRYESSFQNKSFIIALDECKEKKYWTEDEIIKKGKRFVIITGDPGCGKTVLMEYVLHKREKLSKPAFYWFIKVTLKECHKYLVKYSNLRITRNAIKFLSECENLTGKFPISILEDYLNESRLIIFFDGFENLHSNNQQKVKDLFKFLRYSNVKELWVSTSPSYVEELENVLGVMSFKIESLCDSEQIYEQDYIPRTLSQINKVDSRIFPTFSEDIVILTVGKKFSVTDFNRKHSLDLKFENLKFFNTWDSYFYTKNKFSYLFLEEFYNKKKEIVGNRSIHWFTFLGSDLRYESSYKYESFIIVMDECEKKKCLTEDEIIEKERFVIITGDSGSGKTFLLENVLQKLEKLNKPAFYWFIMISLRECQENLEKYSNLRVTENAIKFLSECEKSADEFSRNILNNFLKESRVVLFFDGFEDLNSKNQQKIKDLFTFLISSNVKQLWITTSPQYIEELENTLGVVSFKIEGLNEEEQINLVASLWNVSHKDSSSINDFHIKSKMLIENFASSFESQRTLLASPLYTLMLAVTFKDEIDNETSFNCEGVDLVRLCKNYLNEGKKKSYYRKSAKKIKLLKAKRRKTKKQLNNVDIDYDMETFNLEWIQYKKLKKKISLGKKLRKFDRFWEFFEEERKYEIRKRFQRMLRNMDHDKTRPFVRNFAQKRQLHARKMKLNKPTKNTNNFHAFSFSIYEESKIGYYEKKEKKKIKSNLKKLSTNISENATIRWRKPSRIKKYENKIKVKMDTGKCVGTKKVKVRSNSSGFNMLLEMENTLSFEAPVCQKKTNKSLPKDRKKYVSKVQNMNGETLQINKRQKKKLVYILKIENKSILNW